MCRVFKYMNRINQCFIPHVSRFMLHASCLMFLLIFLLPSPVSCKGNWYLLYQPRQRIVKSIVASNDSLIVGTGNGILTSNDHGNTWSDFGSEQLSKDINGNSTINWISIDEVNKKIYIATNFGAYYSSFETPNWKKFFENSKLESNEVNALEANNDEVYLATNDGLWIYNLKNNSCKRLNKGLAPDSTTGNYKISHILKHIDKILLASETGIYLLNKKNQEWKKISQGIQSLPGGNIGAQYLFVDHKNILWAACKAGIYQWNGLKQYKRKNHKTFWRKVSNGIKQSIDGYLETNFVYTVKNKLYSASKSGIYSLNKTDEIWIDITDGIRTKEGNKNVYWLAELNNELYAATDEGLFVRRQEARSKRQEARSKDRDVACNVSTEDKKQIIQPQNINPDQELLLEGKVEADFTNIEALEPSVIEVQREALRFASLPTNNDYKKYRLQARLRNIIPKIGFDLNSTGTNLGYYQFEKGISSDVSLNNKFDANRLTRLQHDGKSYKQVTVSWDANQLLYDDEIKEILNLARLTANIKENLLDDVTRIYYQRRRLQLENMFQEAIDIKSKTLKELEVAELTGQLDSRTGGWFSKEVQKRKQL